ncbi:Hyphal_reg_CWP domain-containing protein [Caenorhabditis elegans]|uniref:Hyphal_reg_CWP domain-containing protein n=1 Tax=Caenorhabditis elegans TaxID=6239 RepID=A0A1N7SYZ4_CAEEL|nr:Hyphal_reg_CWP domain-containing protein [Caenorhabditis elegans]SIT60458.1 Hyphal_reg_CWP domain-containing protein [Caenorhabditis elegans]|eukprot:NP_001335568.1 Uncharacterized protein CELE_C26G2.2 [Caenorhabditis elegans]
MKRHVVLSLLLYLIAVESKLSRRFKRQTIPSQHIKIHSIDSKVNMDRFINVASMDSRIQLLEKNVNGTFWSASSKMQFDAYDSFVNASFNSQYFHIDIAQCELLFGNSLESLLYMTTNRTSDGHSYLTFSLYDNANMTLVEEGIEFQGINGRRIYVKSETWVRPVEKTISLGLSDNAIDGETAVELTIVAPVHNTNVRFVGAEILIKYGPNVVSIDPNFQKVIVYNDRYSYCLDTKSPGSLHVTFGNGLINLIGGSSDFNVVISPVDATVNARYLSKTQIDRGDGPIFISGVPIYETGITVNSLLLILTLNNNGMLHADCTGAETLLKTSIQNVGLTTEHQEIRINGGVPGLVIESGDVRFEVTKLSGPMAFTYLPGFTLPEDRFENIGPYSDNSTVTPLVFPNPEHLNYTELATDCKGNTINFNITNNLNTSTGYHLVTFPTVGIPGHEQTTTSKMPSTDDDYITPEMSSTASMEITLSTTSDLTSTYPSTFTSSWSTESTVLTTQQQDTTTSVILETTEATDAASSSLSPDDVSTQLTTEATTSVVSSVPPDSSTSKGPLETTTEETSTVEGLTEFSTLDPNLFTTTDNIVSVTTNEILTTTIEEQTTTLPEVYSTTETPTENPLTTVTEQTVTEATTPISLQSSTTASELESTTMEAATTTEVPMETTTISVTTDGYPLPSQLSTDDFVIGHWFSTEEMKIETTTEPSEIGITVSLGNVDFVTPTPTDDGIPIPNDLNINSESSTTSTALPIISATLEVGNSEDGFPEPSRLPQTETTPRKEKMLILKLQVPDEIDVNSVQFIKNITASLRRLVRDVSTELRKRRKRSLNVTSIDTRQYHAIPIADSDDVQSIPIKVENITKSLNITVVIFALEFDPVVSNGEEELEKALHEVDTYNLHRYFSFEPVEKISFDRTLVNEEKLREVLLASFVALFLFVIIVVFYLKKKGVLEQLFRKLDRMKCNTLSTQPSAFSPNSPN